jgi:hypothetical protein
MGWLETGPSGLPSMIVDYHRKWFFPAIQTSMLGLLKIATGVS